MSRVSAGTDCRFMRTAAQAVFCNERMSMRLPGFPAGVFCPKQAKLVRDKSGLEGSGTCRKAGWRGETGWR